MSAQPTLMLDPVWEAGWERQSKRPADVAVAIKAFPPFKPMWEFESCDGERVHTQRPVNVSIQLEGPSEEFSGHAYVFECPSLHVFASAESYAEAERMFQDQVVYFYNHYTSAQRDELDERAQKIFDIYSRYFFARVEPN